MIPFVKAHACGNDFLIVDVDAVAEEDRRRATIQLCARNTGVGADGVEYLDRRSDRSASIQLVNADGSIAEISGNGTRCVAAWLAFQSGAAAGDVFKIETDAGTRLCRIIEVNHPTYGIATSMGIPTVAAGSVELGSRMRVEGAIVSLGNPHFVIRVDDDSYSFAGRDWISMGKEICFHPDFPRQTNVEFVHVKSDGEIGIRIFERGVGPTMSSGTGTCASAAAAIAFHGAGPELLVVAPGGAQRVSWSSSESEMTLIGPAALIAHGEAL